METPICTVLIPSRHNPAGLVKAIRSVANPAVEILVRYDDDDLSTRDCTYGYNTVRAFGGPRQGYDFVWRYIAELLQHARGKWVTMLDDDCTLDGEGWLETLSELGPCLAYPRFYRLGNSLYEQAIKTDTFYLPGWFLPLSICQHEFKGDGGVDVQAFDIAKRHSLTYQSIASLTYNHQRNEQLSLNR